jgi:hypothetical protein
MHCNKFLNILKVELDDALQDFDALIELYHQKHAEGRLTDYVLQQNVGFVQTEKQGLRDVRRALDRVELCDGDELEDARETLEQLITETVRHHDLPAPARDYMLRKMEKVFRYVSEGELRVT